MNSSNDREDDLPLNKTGGLAAAGICASEGEACRLRKRTLRGIPAAWAAQISWTARPSFQGGV